MMEQRISLLISRMKLIKEYDQIKSKNERRKQADTKYKILSYKINKMLESYIYARDVLEFKLSDSTMLAIKELIQNCKDTIVNEEVDYGRLNKTEKKFNTIKEKIQIEWKYFFSDLTGNLIQTLNIFKEVKGEEIIGYVSSIQKSSEWTEDNTKIDRLKDNIKNAKKYLSGINTNPKINIFLSKMNSNNATIKDLDSEILEWIEKENLGYRIKLKF